MPADNIKFSVCTSTVVCHGKALLPFLISFYIVIQFFKIVNTFFIPLPTDRKELIFTLLLSCASQDPRDATCQLGITKAYQTRFPRKRVFRFQEEDRPQHRFLRLMCPKSYRHIQIPCRRTGFSPSEAQALHRLPEQ